MADRFSRATSWIVNQRWLSALAIITISAIAVGGYVAPDALVQYFKSLVEFNNEEELDTEDFVQDLFQEEDFKDPPAVETLTTSGYDAILVAECENLFTPQGATAMREVIQDLEALDYVRDILWVDEIPPLNLFGLNESLLPKGNSAPARFEIAQRKARDHPLVNGRLLSEDGKTLLILIDVDYLFIFDDTPFTEEIRKTAEQTAERHPEVQVDFWLTGGPSVYLKAMQAHHENQFKYQAIAYGMILLLSMILFRGAISVLVVALAPAFGIFWTSGIIRYFEFQLNPFSDVVLPVLVALIGFTDGVHLMVQIRHERASGLLPFQAAKEGLRKVGLACFLTSLTTAVGFGSLSLANHELVREFGFCCVIGVGLSFVAVILTIPLACSTWLGQRVHKGHGAGFVDKHISRISLIIEFVLKHNKWVSIVGILVSIAFFLTSLTLEPDERSSDILPTSSEPAIALKKVDKAMGGLQEVTIDIVWNRDVKDRKGGAELITVLGKIDDALNKEQLVGHPISLFNLLDALPGDAKAENKVSMLELLPPSLKRTYYLPEYRRASVKFRVQDLGIAKYGPVFYRIEDDLEEIFQEHPNFHGSMEGEIIWKWRNIYQIVVDLATSLGMAAIIIFVILAVVYRSLRIGIISILPNMFPLCVAGTFLALTGQNLEIVTVCAFTCCLGIAVDDTIHFLTRYAEELRDTSDESLAIRRAFTTVGTALVMTTLVLVSGFLTVFMSDAREHRIFASMGAITVASALFGDLVFLPAILARFKGRSANQKKIKA